METLVDLLNLQLTSFRKMTSMVIDTQREPGARFEAYFDCNKPDLAEQEKVSDLLKTYSLEFDQEWFGSEEYQLFLSLWQHFAKPVNLLILDDIEQTKKHLMKQEIGLYHTVKAELAKWQFNIQPAPFWDQLENKVKALAITKLEKELVEERILSQRLTGLTREEEIEARKEEIELRQTIKEANSMKKGFQKQIKRTYGLDLYPFLLRCLQELKRFQSNYENEKEDEKRLSISRCAAHQTSRTPACFKFFQPSRPDKFYCSTRCNSRMTKFRNRK